MNYPLRLLPLFSTLAFLAGCEQPAETAAAQEQDDVILPGTVSTKDFGDYVVHFNAIGTDQLTPEVARQYGIVRSRNRAMLNVSILRKDGESMGTPVTGSVSASAINLTGQLKNLTLREIKEGNAVYYIGETTITDGETLIFTVDATPINEASRFTVRFKKQFFVDD
ncbi:MAG TPA: DUF4426 domain-containing protein [Gammaproteobacteria bacterium]